MILWIDKSCLTWLFLETRNKKVGKCGFTFTMTRTALVGWYNRSLIRIASALLLLFFKWIFCTLLAVHIISSAVITDLFKLHYIASTRKHGTAKKWKGLNIYYRVCECVGDSFVCAPGPVRRVLGIVIREKKKEKCSPTYCVKKSFRLHIYVCPPQKIKI